jgi:inward rectifier potassium channel
MKLQTKNRGVYISNNNGKLEVEGIGKWHSYWRDPYHLFLTIPWWGFIGLVSLGYLSINIIFAFLYLAGGDCLSGAKPGLFSDYFFFSVHTLASIGYGVIAPDSNYANFIVTLEAIVSLLSIAVVTGLAFARFSRPTARVRFSQNAVVSLYNGIPTLIFRAANERRNFVLEAEVRVYFSRDEVTAEGESMRRFYELKLSRHRTPSFSLSWNIMHPIDEGSPLYYSTAESLIEDRSQLIVSIVGIDETVAYTIHARHIYSASEVFWNHRFADVVRVTATGDRFIDYNHFDRVLPLDASLTFAEGDRK